MTKISAGQYRITLANGGIAISEDEDGRLSLIYSRLVELEDVEIDQALNLIERLRASEREIMNPAPNGHAETKGEATAQPH
jgi:hypothetical protein